MGSRLSIRILYRFAGKTCTYVLRGSRVRIALFVNRICWSASVRQNSSNIEFLFPLLLDCFTLGCLLRFLPAERIRVRGDEARSARSINPDRRTRYGYETAPADHAKDADNALSGTHLSRSLAKSLSAPVAPGFLSTTSATSPSPDARICAPSSSL